MRGELAQLTRRLEVLRAEATLGGRLSVFSTGEIPLSPEKDPRVRLAAGAGLGGALLPVTGLLLVSYVRRRYRFSDDAQDEPNAHNVPLIGILPEITGDMKDQEQTMSAAHSVHQVRVSLQARAVASGSRVFLVTSATAGEGKTSMTLSLGLSFAVSGQRTLVIDGDLVGRHLTSNLGAQQYDGLHEALQGGGLQSYVKQASSGLYVLSAGRAAAQHAYSLPAVKLRTVLEQARKSYDVVLIDTGPVLGSVEAAVLAQQVDGVIFAVTRGQQRRLVDQSLTRLIGLGVKIEGIIFNRAKPSDFNRSNFTSSFRSVAQGESNAEGRLNLKGKRGGALVNAVDESSAAN